MKIEIGRSAELATPAAMSEPTKYFLSSGEMRALEEIAKRIHAGRDYWWKQASMRKLEARGFVRRRSGSETLKTASWEITDAGRHYLSGFPHHG